MDTIDLYQAHCWDPVTPLEETLAAFAELVAAGKVRYVGVSNFAGWQLQRAALLGRRPGHAPVVTLQPQYSLLSREIEWELVPLCLEEGIGMLPWSPLGGGWLTGKYSRDERPSGATRLGEDPDRGQEAWDRRNTERTWAVVDAVQEIADAHGASMAQVALAWVTGRPGVTSTILGTRTVEQLDDNLGAAQLELEPEQVARLDEVSDPGLPPYPYGFIADERGPGRAERLMGYPRLIRRVGRTIGVLLLGLAVCQPAIAIARPPAKPPPPRRRRPASTRSLRRFRTTARRRSRARSWPGWRRSRTAAPSSSGRPLLRPGRHDHAQRSLRAGDRWPGLRVSRAHAGQQPPRELATRERRAT